MPKPVAREPYTVSLSARHGGSLLSLAEDTGRRTEVGLYSFNMAMFIRYVCCIHKTTVLRTYVRMYVATQRRKKTQRELIASQTDATTETPPHHAHSISPNERERPSGLEVL
jgi:hypothetical protein